MPRVITQPQPGQGSNLRPLDLVSDAILFCHHTTPTLHLLHVFPVRLGKPVTPVFFLYLSHEKILVLHTFFQGGWISSKSTDNVNGNSQDWPRPQKNHSQVHHFFQPIMDSLMKEPIAPCNQLARSTQPCIKIKYWLWPGKGRSVTFARWQVTVRDSTLWDPVSVKFVCSFTCIICHSKMVYYTLHYNKPTDQSTAGHLTATRYAWDDLACNINVELGTREAIKEEQWLSSMA